MDRRQWLGGGAALVATAAFAGRDAAAEGFAAAVARIERETGGRIGLAVLDARSGRRLGFRADERFALCSTAKLPLVAAVLARVDRGRERLDRRLAVTGADLPDHAPFVRARIGGEASLAELCAAAIMVSDNGAANLLLGRVGGPAGVTRFVRGCGDAATRLDRPEPLLNSAVPGDPRDTTTPAAMAALLRRLLLGDGLSPGSRRRLAGWMFGCTTGAAKLRAGLPADWRVADKTGAGAHGADGDVAMLLPPGRAPLLVASYLAESDRPPAARAAVHARLARLIAAGVAPAGANGGG